MNSNKRIAKNVVYIYLSVFLCTLLSLVTIKILLNNLGDNEYGIYNLVAGVITMLSFFRGSMIISIQRFMNVAYGENNIDKINRIFSVGFLLFFIVALIIAIIVEFLGPYISNGYLNISPSRIKAASLLFQVLVISTFISTCGVPYDALFNVHEDMGIFSIFNFLEFFLKFVFAFLLGYINIKYRLVFYGIALGVIALIIYISKYVVCKKKYSKIHLIKLNRSDVGIAKEILSFVGWSLYSSLAKIFSVQGYAVVLNLFMGTAINASYGIANQVNGALQNLTSSIDKAFTPQITKSEGMHDNKRMINLSLYSTKFCCLIYSLFAIPILFSISFILKTWLKTPPEYTLQFTRIILTASIVSMLTLGLAPMLYAKGKIKQYLFILGTFLILVVIGAYIILKLGLPVTYAVSLFIFLECILLVVRLYYCHKIVGLRIKDYIKIVFFPYTKAAIPTLIISIFLNDETLFNTICLFGSMILMYLTCLYFFSLTKQERQVISNQTLMFMKKCKSLISG